MRSTGTPKEEISFSRVEKEVFKKAEDHIDWPSLKFFEHQDSHSIAKNKKSLLKQFKTKKASA